MPERTDRRISLLVALSGLVAVLLIAGTPALISTSSTAEQVREGNEIAACRSEAASVVTEARTLLDVRNARLNVLVSEGLQAAIEDDVSTLEHVVSGLPDARATLVEAEAALSDAIENYRALLDLSRDDPSAFLSLCN